MATLVADIKELISNLTVSPAFIIGQDWGAITYNLSAAFPSLVRKAIVMALPHPRMVQMLMVSPEMIHRAFH